MSYSTTSAPRGCGNQWDEAVSAATDGAKGAATERAWGALDRAGKAGHLLGSADLVQGAPVAEVALRAGATEPLALGFAWVDGQLKVDRVPIRALAKAALKARRAFDKAAKQAAQQGGSCPRPPHRDAVFEIRSWPPNARRLPEAVAGGLSGGVAHAYDCNSACVG